MCEGALISSFVNPRNCVTSLDRERETKERKKRERRGKEERKEAGALPWQPTHPPLPHSYYASSYPLHSSFASLSPLSSFLFPKMSINSRLITQLSDGRVMSPCDDFSRVYISTPTTGERTRHRVAPATRSPPANPRLLSLLLPAAIGPRCPPPSAPAARRHRPPSQAVTAIGRHRHHPGRPHCRRPRGTRRRRRLPTGAALLN